MSDDRPPAPEPPPPAVCFLQEEQRQRRREIDALIERLERDQRYGLVITGLVWSWLAANIDRVKVSPEVAVAAALLTPAIMVLFRWRWRAIDHSVRRIAEYTRELERSGFRVPAPLGWESWLADRRDTAGETQSPIAVSTSWWWWTLILANAAIGALFVWVILTGRV